MVLLLAKLGEPTDWTLCGRDPVQVQVTVPPIAMVSTAGFVLPLWPLTNWMLGPAVTEPAVPTPTPTAAVRPRAAIPAASCQRRERQHADYRSAYTHFGILLSLPA